MTKDTSFDGVRRFGMRVAGVSWIGIEWRQCEKQCANIDMMGVCRKYQVECLLCGGRFDCDESKDDPSVSILRKAL